MIEILPIKIESTLDWSILLLVFSGIAFYFGKIINEVSPYRANDYSNYENGFVFVLTQVILPLLILFTIFGSGIPHIELIFGIIAFVFQFILLWWLNKRYQIIQLNRVGRTEWAQRLGRKEIKKFIKKLNLNKHGYQEDNNIKISFSFYELMYYRELPNWLLLVITTITFFLTGVVIISSTWIILIFISILISFVSLSIIAVIYGWNINNQQPEITISVEGGKLIRGHMTKINDMFVSIRDKKRIYNIPLTKIEQINEKIIDINQ